MTFKYLAHFNRGKKENSFSVFFFKRSFSIIKVGLIRHQKTQKKRKAINVLDRSTKLSVKPYNSYCFQRKWKDIVRGLRSTSR